MAFILQAIKNGCWYKLRKTSWGPCLWGQLAIAELCEVALGIGIRQLMITLLNLPILQSLLQVQGIYICTMGSPWLNFSCLQVRHLPRGHKQLSQIDWTKYTVEIPSWIVVWYSPKTCWYTYSSACVCAFTWNIVSAKGHLCQEYGVVLSHFSQLFRSFPQESQMSF